MNLSPKGRKRFCMKEVIMVAVALLLGILFGTVVRYWMDSKYIDEIGEVYEKDKADFKRTMEMREKMNINTINNLHKMLLERDKTIVSQDKELDGYKMEKAAWMKQLENVSDPVPGNDEFGGITL